MKYLTLLIAFILVSCRTNDAKIIRTPLLAEAPAFSQRERRIQPYRIEKCGWKSRQCLIQEGNVFSDFAVLLKKRPVLQYKLEKLADGTLLTGIVVESDFPSAMRQEYPAVAGSFQEIPLGKFEDRITRIRFFTKQQAGPTKTVNWIEPLILQSRNDSVPSDSGQLQSLRKRHQSDNVFLIVLDAGGSSHFGFAGNSKNPTPMIDAVAKEGIFWDHAVSQAASTVASTGSLLTGLYPSEHKTLLSNSLLRDRFVTLPEYFRAYGYRTALFSGNPNASAMTGYGQGFDRVWQPHTGQAANASDFVLPVQNWIDSHKSEKLFVYLHLREPHSPFKPPHDLWKKMDPQTDYILPSYFMHEIPNQNVLQRIVAAYEANLASADRELGKIFDHLKSTGLWDHSLIVVLADHGEAFWEHGKQGHNYPLYEEILRIPFVLRIPGEPELAAKRISIAVGSIDLLPTLVDLFQFSRRGSRWSGISLLPSIYGRTDDRVILSQTVRRRIYSCRWRNIKYIWHKEDGIDVDELYSLSNDPQEKRNLIRQYPILASYLHLQLARYLHQSHTFEKPLRADSEKAPEINQDVKEELRALGYVDQ